MSGAPSGARPLPPDPRTLGSRLGGVPLVLPPAGLVADLLARIPQAADTAELPGWLLRVD
ncbi:MAG: hypothetical protein HOQ12_10330, partial [Gemmatimonadaceae bacterium]|nr:hypothetical protein [Gemmatimonadaceae bacterium]